MLIQTAVSALRTIPNFKKYLSDSQKVDALALEPCTKNLRQNNGLAEI